MVGLEYSENGDITTSLVCDMIWKQKTCSTCSKVKSRLMCIWRVQDLSTTAQRRKHKSYKMCHVWHTIIVHETAVAVFFSTSVTQHVA